MRQTFDETTDPSFGAKHLPLIREQLKAQGLDGFLVPHEDEHQNEYLPAANDRLAWVSGFTGSAGAGVVMTDRAAVFADGRYTVQVRAQVDADQFDILSYPDDVPTYLARAPKGAVIGYDPRLHSPDALASQARGQQGRRRAEAGRDQSRRRRLGRAPGAAPGAGGPPPGQLRR